MAKVEAAAMLTVEFHLDVETLREAEKLLDSLLRDGEDEDRLLRYRVVQEQWVPIIPSLD